MIGFFQKVINQLRRVVGAEPAPLPEPKKPRGRPKKYMTEEERRAGDAKRHAEYRARERRKLEDEQRKKAEQRTVGQLVTQQDSAGDWHFYVVLAIDAEGHATKREEVARDESGNPRKYGNGRWMFLKDMDEPLVLNPAPAPIVPVQPPKPVPVAQPAVPEPPAPQPNDNAAAVIHYHQAHEFAYEPDPTRFFLVHEQASADDAAERFGQRAISIPQWHESYAELDVFAAAEIIWVLVADASDKAWLQSLAAANQAMREKMRVAVGDIPNVFSTAVSYARHARQTKSSFSAHLVGFEQSCQFQPMPQDAEQVDKLLQPPPKPQPAQTPSELNMFGGTGYAPASGWKPKLPSSGSGTENDGSVACH